MSPPLWMSIEPIGPEVRLMLSTPTQGTTLKARLPSAPSHTRSLVQLLEALSLWYGQPLHAVVDANAQDVRQHPDRWAKLLGDAPDLAVSVEWVSVPGVRKDRFLGTLGDFSRGRRLVRVAATGQR